jgi:putative ABC transport system substrate-binding protein
MMLPEPIAITPVFTTQIYAFADAHHIPVAGEEIQNTELGPIFNIIPDSNAVGQLAAPLADKIFKGTPAGSIPVVTPELRFEINQKALTRLGLTASESLLSVADKVVH